MKMMGLAWRKGFPTLLLAAVFVFASLTSVYGRSSFLDSRADDEGRVRSKEEQLVAIVVPAVFFAGVIVYVVVYSVCRITRHRRDRRSALLRKDEWVMGKDAQKGRTNQRLFIQNTFVGIDSVEEIVLDGEWFEMGSPSERSWWLFGSKWANDLASRGLNWTELHARKPEVCRDRPVDNYL